VRVANRQRLGLSRRLVALVLAPLIGRVFRLSWGGQEHVPQSGGVILVANHVSYADPFGLARFVYDSGRFPSFLAKESLFRIPVVGAILRRVGQIPVRRGSRDARDALRDAVAAVRAGECVCIYPEGTVTRDPDWWPMTPKTGVARLALETGAPVVPVAQWGAQFVYDRYRGRVDFLPRKTVRCLAGPAVDLSEYRDRPVTAELLREVSEKVMGAVRDLLGEIRGEAPPEGFFDPQRGEERR
jgi:1-acyl-sn-glycerol-3-phosphate acyltransferase